MIYNICRISICTRCDISVHDLYVDAISVHDLSDVCIRYDRRKSVQQQSKYRHSGRVDHLLPVALRTKHWRCHHRRRQLHFHPMTDGVFLFFFLDWHQNCFVLVGFTVERSDSHPWPVRDFPWLAVSWRVCFGHFTYPLPQQPALIGVADALPY